MHVILTLATSGIWLIIYAPRLYFNWRKLHRGGSSRFNVNSNSRRGIYSKRVLKSTQEIEEDEWSDFHDPYSFQIVGESHYRENLLALIEAKNAHQIGEIEVDAELIKEPENKFDENAVSVVIEGKKVGHVSKEYSFDVTEYLEERNLDSIKVKGAIGWNTNSPNPPIGVRLDFNF